MDDIFKQSNYSPLTSLQDDLKTCVQKDPNVWFQVKEEALKAVDFLIDKYQKQVGEDVKRGTIIKSESRNQLEKLSAIRTEIATTSHCQNLTRKEALQLVLFHWTTILKQKGFTGIEKELKTHGLKRPLSYQGLLWGNLTITQFVILAVITIVMYLIFRILRGF